MFTLLTRRIIIIECRVGVRNPKKGPTIGLILARSLLLCKAVFLFRTEQKNLKQFPIKSLIKDRVEGLWRRSQHNFIWNTRNTLTTCTAKTVKTFKSLRIRTPIAIFRKSRTPLLSIPSRFSNFLRCSTHQTALIRKIWRIVGRNHFSPSKCSPFTMTFTSRLDFSSR